MAKIKWSAIGITNASGKSGGSVFSHNRGGAYVRRWAKPVNAQNPAQTAYRALFGWVSKQYGQLSPEAVAAWEQWGKDNPITDVFGDAREMSPFGAFMKANQNNIHSGLPYLEYPRAKPAPAMLELSRFDLDINPSGTKLIFDVAAQSSDSANNYSASIAFAIIPKGSNRSFGSVKNQFQHRVRKTFAADDADVDFSPADLTSLLGAVSEGDKVIMQLHVHYADGSKTAPQTFETVVVDTTP